MDFNGLVSDITPFPGLCSYGAASRLIRTLPVLTKPIRPARPVIVAAATFFVFTVTAAVIVVESGL